MNTSGTEPVSFAHRTVLVVGMGGLGCPAALALARAGVGALLLADDDTVDLTNLHRQILFTDDDVGRDKLDSAARALGGQGAGRIECIRTRLLPDNARDLVRRADVVVEGTDNFATKFLAADACHLEGRPIVHGAAIRFRATAWAVDRKGAPCYRCLFEDLPEADAAPSCNEAGVMGPVAGIAGALLADLALRLLSGDRSCTGKVLTYDGLSDRLRAVDVAPRPGCPLCGPEHRISDIQETRYTGAPCAA